jgi:hypothetical protein
MPGEKSFRGQYQITGSCETRLISRPIFCKQALIVGEPTRSAARRKLDWSLRKHRPAALVRPSTQTGESPMRYLTVILIACLAWLGTALDAYPSEPGRTPRPDAHEPGPKNPFGSRHPEAPAEISQYEFMIGEWSCTERFRQADGSWSEFDSLVRSRYFLNGNAIMNQTFLPDSAAAMTY